MLGEILEAGKGRVCFHRRIAIYCYEVLLCAEFLLWYLFFSFRFLCVYCFLEYTLFSSRKAANTFNKYNKIAAIYPPRCLDGYNM